MKIMKRVWSALILTALLLGCMGGMSAFAATNVEIVRDGLVVWYDGTNNYNGTQDMETAVWKDLTGNGNHLTLKLDDKNYWKENAFHIDSTPNYFPDGVLEVVNSETFTVEMVLGELAYTGTDWVTMMCSDNDNLSLFIRQDNNNLEYKHYNVSEDRCMVEGGGDLCNDSTLAITFDKMVDGVHAIRMYVDGVLLAEGQSKYADKADTLFFCHEDIQRAWSGDLYGFRFYNRALSPEEVEDNAMADNRKYRRGEYFPPVEEYEEEGDIDIGGTTHDYVNHRITITPEVDVLNWADAYDNVVYCYDGQWEGARMQVTKPEEVEDNVISPEIVLNYQKYVRRNGLENLKGEDVNYIVVKATVDGMIGDLTLWGMYGNIYSWYEGAFHVGSYYGGAECTGEVEYLIYDVTGMWEGEINSLTFSPDGYEDATIYLHEVAFFADEDAALIYAGEISDSEETTADENGSDETVAADTDGETDTEEPADSDTTAPENNTQSTEETTAADEKSGCGAAVGFGAVAILTAAAAAAVWNKKRD